MVMAGSCGALRQRDALNLHGCQLCCFGRGRLEEAEANAAVVVAALPADGHGMNMPLKVLKASAGGQILQGYP
jgi:hypothetical protein